MITSLNHRAGSRVFTAFPIAWLPLFLLLAAKTLPADSIPWNVSLSATEADSGITSTYATVGGTVSYNSTNPALGTGAGATTNILPTPTTTYVDPTVLGLTSATSSVSSSNNNGGNPWCDPNGCVSGTVTASALATGNLATGSVGVSADSSYLGGSVESQASATAQIADKLLFMVAGATASTITDIGVTFTISGSALPGAPLEPGVSGPGVEMSGDLTMGAGSIDYAYNDAAGDSADGTVELDSGWLSSQIVSQSPDSFVFSGVYQLTGASDTVPITLELICSAQNGGSCDFADTGAVGFNLPAGVTFTSASGVFLTEPLTATPEPASEALILGGLMLGIAVWRRRWMGRSRASVLPPEN